MCLGSRQSCVDDFLSMSYENFHAQDSTSNFIENDNRNNNVSQSPRDWNFKKQNKKRKIHTNYYDQKIALH